jgi:hypothetical protein
MLVSPAHQAEPPDLPFESTSTAVSRINGRHERFCFLVRSRINVAKEIVYRRGSGVYDHGFGHDFRQGLFVGVHKETLQVV